MVNGLDRQMDLLLIFTLGKNNSILVFNIGKKGPEHKAHMQPC